MRVFLTGSSSHLARALLPRLCAHRDVEQVTGIDIARPCFADPKFRALALDVRDAGIERAMAGHDALIHMAFVVLRGRTGEQEMRSVNIDGAQRVFRAARAAGIARCIHLSSAAVYGGGVHLRETAPLAPLRGFLYGRHKAMLETWLAAEFPECARLRPHAILGPHAQPLLRWLVSRPVYPKLPDPQPLLQCVHEDDVAGAILLALEADAHGAYNLATEDAFTFREEVRRRHRLTLPLPLPIARAALNTAWRLTGWGGEPAWIEGLANTLTLDSSRARRELGWQPEYSSAETLALV